MGGEALSGTRGGYPLYRIFWPLYEGGGVAVQFFWMISGFVFAAVYSGSAPSGRNFFVSRFARLYPLHFLTLIVVAALQIVSFQSFGGPLLYANNDGYHFILNLLFASSWGLENGRSFNGPIWSVSLEVGIYALFWLTLGRLFKVGVALPVLASALFFVAFKLMPSVLIFNCGLDFFVGCALFAVSCAIPGTITVLAGSSLAACAAACWILFRTQGIATMVAFAGVILLVAAAENSARLSRAAERLKWFGDCTYGLYLWHVPLQIFVLIVLAKAGIDRDIFYSPWVLVAFLLTMVGIARLSYIYVEAPWRRRIQRWGAVPRKTDAPIAAP